LKKIVTPGRLVLSLTLSTYIGHEEHERAESSRLGTPKRRRKRPESQINATHYKVLLLPSPHRKLTEKRYIIMDFPGFLLHLHYGASECSRLICDSLSSRDIRSPRLTCKTVEHVASSYPFLTRAYISSHAADLEAFRGITSNPKPARHVTEIIWDDTTFNRMLFDFTIYKPLWKCPDRYRDHLEKAFISGKSSRRNIGRSGKENSTSRRWPRAPEAAISQEGRTDTASLPTSSDIWGGQ